MSTFLTRSKNNQITDSTILANTKVVPGSIVGSLFNQTITTTSDWTITGNLTVTGTTTTTNIKTNGILSNRANVSVTSATVIDEFTPATYRSAKYQVQMTSGTSYHTIEIMVLHDGTTVFMTQYDELFTGPVSLGQFDAGISLGNLNLLLTPTNAVTTIKLIRNSITV